MIEISYDQAIGVLDLPSGEGRGVWSSAICPAHDDTNPSLRIAQGDGGNVAAKCHKGCDYGQIMEAIEGLLGSSAPKRRRGGGKRAPAPPKGKHIASYTYTSVDGLPMAVKKRYQLGEEKTFIWCDPQDTDKLGLPGNMTESNLPLYSIEDVVGRKKKKVIWVEGEKAADALKEAYGSLAICLPGGSTADPTDDQMEPLRGRNVILWPDNDEPGRTLMRKVADKIASIAAEVTMVMPYVPPGGDAYNYVKAGHTKEQLKKEIGSTHQEAKMVELPDGYEVIVPDTGGVVKFSFLDLYNGPRTIDADIVVWRDMTGASGVSYSARQNLQSASSRAGFVKQLSQHFGPDTKDSVKMWSRIVDTAYGKVQESQRNREPAELVLSALPLGANSLHLIKPLVADDGMTIPFGMGGAGKSYISLVLAVITALDQDDLPAIKALGLRPRSHGDVVYIDYEASRERAQRRVKGILRGFGLDPAEYEDLPIHYWSAQGIPLTNDVHSVRKLYKKTEAVLLIVDSLSRACGDDLKSQEVVSAYSNAIARIGATASISIAHVTKDQGTQHPFGSVFWHNDPRLTWYVQNVPQDEGMGVMMENRKANDAALANNIGYKFTFTGSDDEEAADGFEPNEFTVTITRDDDMEEPDSESQTQEQQVLAYLESHAEGALQKELRDALSITSIGTVLGRLRDKQLVRTDHGRSHYEAAKRKKKSEI